MAITPSHRLCDFGSLSIFLLLLDHEAEFPEAQTRSLADLFCPPEKVQLSP